MFFFSEPDFPPYFNVLTGSEDYPRPESRVSSTTVSAVSFTRFSVLPWTMAPQTTDASGFLRFQNSEEITKHSFNVVLNAM